MAVAVTTVAVTNDGGGGGGGWIVGWWWWVEKNVMDNVWQRVVAKHCSY